MNSAECNWLFRRPSNDFIYVVVIVWLSLAQVDGKSVLVSDLIESSPDQALASDVYASIPTSANSLSIQAWINIASQSFALKRELLCFQSSQDPAVVMPSFHILNSTYLAVELTTSRSGNRTETQIFSYPLMFEEWIFVDVEIRSGSDRSITMTLAFPDSTIIKSTKQLDGDMIRSQTFDLLMTPSRRSNTSVAHVFVAYLVVDQSSSTDAMLSSPNQVYSMATTAGGQVFQQTYSVLNLACQLPGSTLTSIDFASFGRPRGVFPNFRLNPNCHGNRTMEIVRSACYGRQRCSIAPDTELFGDPCPGQNKNIAIVATCSLEQMPNMQRAAVEASLMDLDAGATHPPIDVLEAVNVSLQILFDSEKTTLSSAMTTFISAFDLEFNATSDRIFNPNIRSLRYPLVLFTFTLMPPTTLYDLVPARYLAQAFSRYMQSSTSILRRQTLLSGAPQPPIAVGMIDVKIRLCNGRYIYVGTKQDSCTDAKDFSSQITTLQQSTITIFVIVCLIAAFFIFIALFLLSRKRNLHLMVSETLPVKNGVSHMPIPVPVVIAPKQVEAISPSNFSIVESENGERPQSNTKLSIKTFPMRIERLAVVRQQTKSLQTTDSETDSAFLSDVHHLSVESGPARVVDYFTDSS